MKPLQNHFVLAKLATSSIRVKKLFTNGLPPGGGGGGGGTSLSKFKNTPKALISGQKAPLSFKKCRLLQVKNTPTFIKTLTLNGSPVTSGVTRRQSCIYFVDCKGISIPHTSYLGTKKYPSFTKSRACEGFKKDPSFREICNAGAALLCTWVPSPVVCHDKTWGRNLRL